MANLDRLLAMLERGRDDALVRFGIGSALLGDGRAADAVTHLRAAVAHNADYSAAWKLLGKALTDAGDLPGALQAYDDGIATAERVGDRQAAKEMTVFARRLRRSLDDA